MLLVSLLLQLLAGWLIILQYKVDFRTYIKLYPLEDKIESSVIVITGKTYTFGLLLLIASVLYKSSCLSPSLLTSSLTLFLMGKKENII